MINKFSDCVHSSGCDLRSFQALDDLGSGKFLKHILHDSFQLQTMLKTFFIRIKSNIHAEFRKLKNLVAKSFPLTLILQAKEDDLAITAVHWAVGRNGGVICSRSSGCRASVRGVCGRKTHP